MVWILGRYIKKCWVNRVNENICRLEVAASRPFWIWSSWNFDQILYLKLHILFNSNGLAIWCGFPDITHVKKIIGYLGRHDLVSVRILPNFELVRAISEMDIWYKFWGDT